MVTVSPRTTVVPAPGLDFSTVPAGRVLLLAVCTTTIEPVVLQEVGCGALVDAHDVAQLHVRIGGHHDLDGGALVGLQVGTGVGAHHRADVDVIPVIRGDREIEEPSLRQRDLGVAEAHGDDVGHRRRGYVETVSRTVEPCSSFFPLPGSWSRIVPPGRGLSAATESTSKPALFRMEAAENTSRSTTSGTLAMGACSVSFA